jgi:hypothetical protein
MILYYSSTVRLDRGESRAQGGSGVEMAREIGASVRTAKQPLIPNNVIAHNNSSHSNTLSVRSWILPLQ